MWSMDRLALVYSTNADGRKNTDGVWEDCLQIRKLMRPWRSLYVGPDTNFWIFCEILDVFEKFGKLEEI